MTIDLEPVRALKPNLSPIGRNSEYFLVTIDLEPVRALKHQLVYPHHIADKPDRYVTIDLEPVRALKRLLVGDSDGDCHR